MLVNKKADMTLTMSLKIILTFHLKNIVAFQTYFLPYNQWKIEATTSKNASQQILIISYIDLFLDYNLYIYKSLLKIKTNYFISFVLIS